MSSWGPKQYPVLRACNQTMLPVSERISILTGCPRSPRQRAPKTANQRYRALIEAQSSATAVSVVVASENCRAGQVIWLDRTDAVGPEPRSRSTCPGTRGGRRRSKWSTLGHFGVCRWTGRWILVQWSGIVELLELNLPAHPERFSAGRDSVPGGQNRKSWPPPSPPEVIWPVPWIHPDF